MGGGGGQKIRTNFDDRKKCGLTFTFHAPNSPYPHRLKGHGNEADFLGFLQKWVQHRLFTIHFEPFRYGLRIPGDIRNRKTTPRLAESGSRQECL